MPLEWDEMPQYRVRWADSDHWTTVKNENGLKNVWFNVSREHVNLGYRGGIIMEWEE